MRAYQAAIKDTRQQFRIRRDWGEDWGLSIEAIFMDDLGLGDENLILIGLEHARVLADEGQNLVTLGA